MGLRDADLKDMMDHIFEIDSYASKMGDDKDIVTLSFSVRSKPPADDLVSFLEKGYPFILDADVTSGEQSDGTYKVFVEMERNDQVPEQIMELVDGIGKLAAEDKFKFRYYKNFRSVPCTLEALASAIPTDSDNYGIKTNESRLENYKNFFNRSYVDTINMKDDLLTIKKTYADPVHFNFVDFGDKHSILESLEEKINVNDFAEIIFLSKYVGDYNITKYGNKLTFENEDKVLVVERIMV